MPLLQGIGSPAAVVTDPEDYGDAIPWAILNNKSGSSSTSSETGDQQFPNVSADMVPPNTDPRFAHIYFQPHV